MVYSERQNRILELIRDNRMTIAQIAEALGVSEMTVRRDIAVLKKNGVVTQFRGGVSIRSMRSFQSFEMRAEIDKDIKLQLAQKASQYVKDGMLLYIDSSSTCYYIVPFLENFRNLMVVTNSSKVLEALGERGIKVKMASGNYNCRDKCVVGSETEEYIKNYRYDIAFLSASYYDERMITSWSESQTNIRRVVIESAVKTYFLMTPAKYNRHSKFVVCRTDDAEVLTV